MPLEVALLFVSRRASPGAWGRHGGPTLGQAQRLTVPPTCSIGLVYTFAKEFLVCVVGFKSRCLLVYCF